MKIDKTIAEVKKTLMELVDEVVTWIKNHKKLTALVVVGYLFYDWFIKEESREGE